MVRAKNAQEANQDFDDFLMAHKKALKTHTESEKRDPHAKSEMLAAFEKFAVDNWDFGQANKGLATKLDKFLDSHIKKHGVEILLGKFIFKFMGYRKIPLNAKQRANVDSIVSVLNKKRAVSELKTKIPKALGLTMLIGLIALVAIPVAMLLLPPIVGPIVAAITAVAATTLVAATAIHYGHSARSALRSSAKEEDADVKKPEIVTLPLPPQKPSVKVPKDALKGTSPTKEGDDQPSEEEGPTKPSA